MLRWAMIVLAMLPFQILLVQHLASGGATGFLQYDSPYYVANGRAVFERGNGFAHPNPYDPDPASPAIYFHWLTWLLWFGVKILGADPGAVFVVVGLIGALACSALTLRLVETVLPGPRLRWPLFLLTMWGGGALCVGAVVFNGARGTPLLEKLFAFDPADGWWFLNWGRNLVSPMEAVYHALAAAMWLGVLRQQWRLALGAAGAFAATHPFSGLEQLLILVAWLGVLAWRERNAETWRRLAVAAAMLAAFGFYYFWFLEKFPAYRELRAEWSIEWILPVATLLLASGPVAAVAAWRLYRERGRWSDRERFLLVAGAVVLLLAKHDWFIAARQPVHFAHGYNWLPLWLIALPQLQTWAGDLGRVRSRLAAVGVGALVAGFAVSDNALFLFKECREGQANRILLTRDQREVFAWIDRAKLHGVLLCADPRLSYLSATYAGVRPYYGHFHNTPEIFRRRREVAAWNRCGEKGAWLDSIDYLLIERAKPPVAFDWPNWRELYRNGDYVLLGRPS